MKAENILKKIKVNKFKNEFCKMLNRNKRLVLFMLFLFIIIYSGFLWNSSVYNYSWDENKKQEYIKSKTSEDNFFNKTRFESIISKTEKRSANYQNPNETPRDIFGIK